MSVDFKWAIEAKDDTTRTMVVSYSLADNSGMQKFNIPQPPAGSNIDEHIASYAPFKSWVTPPTFEQVESGTTGVGTILPPVVVEPSAPPNVAGNWNEEYLRAMIYQVLEEIKAAQV